MKKNFQALGILFGLLLGASACGVKGPPLPPVSDTPEASEREDKERNRVKPEPSPSPAAKTKKKKKNR